MAKTGSVSIQMHEILDKYGDDAKKAVNESARETARVCVQQLKSTSPKRPGGGAYARSWTVKEERHGMLSNYIIHNARHYQLTHLLENGHVIKNKKGTYGRTHPIKHIAPAEETSEMRFELGVRTRLKRL